MTPELNGYPFSAEEIAKMAIVNNDRVALRPEDLMILDRNMCWAVEPGEFEIMVGASSEDIKLNQPVVVSVVRKEKR